MQQCVLEEKQKRIFAEFPSLHQREQPLSLSQKNHYRPPVSFRDRVAIQWHLRSTRCHVIHTRACGCRACRAPGWGRRRSCLMMASCVLCWARTTGNCRYCNNMHVLFSRNMAFHEVEDQPFLSKWPKNSRNKETTPLLPRGLMRRSAFSPKLSKLIPPTMCCELP